MESNDKIGTIKMGSNPAFIASVFKAKPQHPNIIANAKVRRYDFRSHAGSEPEALQRAGPRKCVCACGCQASGDQLRESRLSLQGQERIVTAILKRLEIDMRQILLGVAKPGESFLPGDAAAYHVEVIQTLWRYRFFFNALTHLLTHDAALRKRFIRLQNNFVDAIKNIFDALIAEVQMNDPPFSTQLLAKSCWMIWLSWLRFEQIENPEDEVVRNVAIERRRNALDARAEDIRTSGVRHLMADITALSDQLIRQSLGTMSKRRIEEMQSGLAGISANLNGMSGNTAKETVTLRLKIQKELKNIP